MARGRTLRWLDDFARDLSHGARILRRSPAFTAIVVATLGLAIAATVTVFGVVDAWLFKPLNFPHPDRLVIAFAARPERPTEPAVWLPYRDYLGWKDRNRSLESIAGAFVRDVTLTTASEAQALLGLAVTPDFFRTLGTPPLVGRSTDDADRAGTRVVVLSHGLWQRRFGAASDIVGATITLSGEPYEVVGVMPRGFETRILDMRFEFWTPFRPGDKGYEPGGVGPLAVLGRLRDGESIDAARSELAALTRDIESGYRSNFNRFIVNLTPLQADNTRTVRATLVTVSAAVVSLLVIAAINVGALMLGHGLVRTREVAIRAAIGSGRARLVRQFFTESLLIAGAGGCLGLAAAAAAMRLFVAWNPLGTLPPNTVHLDLRAVAAAGAAMGVAAIACGLVPALRISLADPNDALRGGERASGTAPAQRTQTLLLVAQMAGCVVMLIAAALFIRTFIRLETEPLGFEPQHLAVANIILPNDPFASADERLLYYGQLAERVAALPGVRSVAAGTSAPLSSGAPSSVYVGAEDATNAPRISTQEVTAGFFGVLEIPLVAGRAFDERDRAGGALTAIVNERAARDLFGGAAAAIGRRLRLDREGWREIVGVAGNVRSSFFNTLEWKTDPIVYRPAAQGFSTVGDPSATTFGFKLHVRSDRALQMADVRSAAAAVNARAAVTELRPASDIVGEATRQPAFRMTLLLWFAGVSLVLAAIGVYGLVSQAVTQRRREMAIRLALGADPSRVVRAITRRALTAGAAGVACGSAIALAAGRALEALLYGVRPRDAMSFAAAAAALVAVTGVAALIPALRAARVDPAPVLRGD
jgi:predicted permease